MEPQVNKTSASFGQVALVQNKAAATEATRTTHLLHPFGPLGIQLTVRLFILRLEHADRFLNSSQQHIQTALPTSNST